MEIQSLHQFEIVFNDKAMSVQTHLAENQVIFQMHYLENLEEYLMYMVTDNNGSILHAVEPEKVMRGGAEISVLLMNYYKSVKSAAA